MDILTSFSTDKWRLSEFNADFLVIPSYPDVVVVPRVLLDTSLVYENILRLGLISQEIVAKTEPVVEYLRWFGVLLENLELY